VTRRGVARIIEGALLLGIVVALGIFHWTGYSAATTPIPRWPQVAWPFPMDQWGKGTAFRCNAADCGAEISLYLRPKIGFCNCTTGVSDDAELERVADVSLLDDRYAPLTPGRPIKVGRMEGRSRPYVVDRAARDKVLAIAFNERCDVIVATAVVAHERPAAFEPVVLAFLNGDTVLRWAAVKLGLEGL
jgi:hypothetical protein